MTEGHIYTLTCTVSKTLLKQKELAKDVNNSVFREHFRIINDDGTEMTQCEYTFSSPLQITSSDKEEPHQCVYKLYVFAAKLSRLIDYLPTI